MPAATHHSSVIFACTQMASSVEDASEGDLPPPSEQEINVFIDDFLAIDKERTGQVPLSMLHHLLWRQAAREPSPQEVQMVACKLMCGGLLSFNKWFEFIFGASLSRTVEYPLARSSGSGWLLTRGPNTGFEWVRRWCVLTDTDNYGALSMYEDKEMQRAAGQLPLHKLAQVDFPLMLIAIILS